MGSLSPRAGSHWSSPAARVCHTAVARWPPCSLGVRLLPCLLFLRGQAGEGRRKDSGCSEVGVREKQPFTAWRNQGWDCPFPLAGLTGCTESRGMPGCARTLGAAGGAGCTVKQDTTHTAPHVVCAHPWGLACSCSLPEVGPSSNFDGG